MPVRAPIPPLAASLLARPGLRACLRGLARMHLDLHAAAPRAASVFATQQRWLFAQTAFSIWFRSRGAGLLQSRFQAEIAAHRLGSRNTAAAFLKEMAHYGHIRAVGTIPDRRAVPLQPTDDVIGLLANWLDAHLAILDALDGAPAFGLAGSRIAVVAAMPGALGRLQPLIADGLMAAPAIRRPAPLFDLFTWATDGGLVMDWLMAHADEAPDADGWHGCAFADLGDLAERLKITRRHLSNLLRRAEALGGIAWKGPRRQPPARVSAGFVADYEAYQAAKLAIIETAYRNVLVPADARPA